MEDFGRIMEDLNSIIGGIGTRPSGVDADIELGESAQDLLLVILADERIRKLKEGELDGAISTLLEMATRPGEYVIWHDEGKPPEPGSIKAEFNDFAKMLFRRHPPAQATAAGDLGMRLWGDAVDEVVDKGKLFDTRGVKKDPNRTVVEANYHLFMRAFKERLAKSGFDLTKDGETRMVDQIEKQIKQAGRDLQGLADNISAEARSRAGRILATTKKRTSYAGKKASGKGKGQDR